MQVALHVGEGCIIIKIIKLNKINDFEFFAIIDGTKKYDVYLNIEHPRKSKCNCPLANGKKNICKHIDLKYKKLYTIYSI